MNGPMSRTGKPIVVIAVIYFFASTIFFSHRTDLSQLLTLPAAFCFLSAVIGSVVCIFTDWKEYRWRSLAPFTACILSVILSSMLAIRIRHAVFIHSLPRYEAVVHQIESGSISVSTNMERIPQAESQAPFAYAVFAERDSNRILTVIFLTEAGFPVKHSGYMYCSSGIIAPGSYTDSRWPIRHEEKPKWFGISD